MEQITSKSNKQIILEIFGAGISRYSSNLEFCKKAFSEESVHDFRVSVRRLITIVRVMNKIVPNHNASPLISLLKSQLGLFNPLRDTQVMILKIQEMSQNHPELEIFGSELKKRERTYIISLKNQIRDLSLSRVEPVFEKITESYFISNVSDSIINAHIINTLNSSFTKVIELNDIASPDDAGTLHRVRLAFKKFRYRAEAFSEIINYPESIRKELGKVQDILGAIQDNSVMIENIREFASDKHLEKVFSSLIIEIKKEGDLLINNYFSSSIRLFDFWSLPGAPAIDKSN